jgi:hypothetical protein
VGLCGFGEFQGTCGCGISTQMSVEAHFVPFFFSSLNVVLSKLHVIRISLVVEAVSSLQFVYSR